VSTHLEKAMEAIDAHSAQRQKAWAAGDSALALELTKRLLALHDLKRRLQAGNQQEARERAEALKDVDRLAGLDTTGPSTNQRGPRHRLSEQWEKDEKRAASLDKRTPEQIQATKDRIAAGQRAAWDRKRAEGLLVGAKCKPGCTCGRHGNGSNKARNRSLAIAEPGA
jgi:hypothetical protein